MVWYLVTDWVPEIPIFRLILGTRSVTSFCVSMLNVPIYISFSFTKKGLHALKCFDETPGQPLKITKCAYFAFGNPQV